MTTLDTSATIAIGFARRQTPESSYGHFEGTEEELITLVRECLCDRVLVAPGIVRVPVPAAGFWSAVRPVEPGEPLTTTFEARAPGEEPVLRTVARGSKAPAKYVEIILYHRNTLGEESSTDADWEMVSINPSPIEDPLPMDPTTMARNQRTEIGGTFQRTYSPEEWAHASWFWARHVSVKP